VPELPNPSPDDILGRLAAVHKRERACLEGLTEEQVRDPSALPGWSRGHVLAARLAFTGAAIRQIDHVLSGRSVDFYDGGRAGREAEVETNAGRPGAELIREVTGKALELEGAWSQVTAPDWTRHVRYREGGPMSMLALASWREAELHLVDSDLGVTPSDWSREFCLHLFDFLMPRVPEGARLELRTPEGETWVLGRGKTVRITGAPTDMAAWLAGRVPVGEIESSAGALPPLRRLRDAQRAGRSA
jgi:maleylpyruvate isomerase